mgnify:CR=1 FL=1
MSHGQAWLAPAGPELSFRAYAVEDGVLPESPGECDAWLVTGSRHGVYDDLPWIEPLKQFLRAARAAQEPGGPHHRVRPIGEQIGRAHV